METNTKNRTIEDLLKSLEAATPPAALKKQVLARIAKTERRSLAIRLSFLGSLSLASLAGMVVSFFYLGRALVATGFTEYFSLLISDNTVLVSYWKEISFSLIESLPLLSVALLLAVAGIFIWSLTKTVRSAKIMRSMWRAA